MKIEMNRQYRTRDGRPARIVCTDRKHPNYRVIALITLDNNSDGSEYENYGLYTLEGYLDADGNKSHNDLVEVSPFDDFEIDDPVMVRDSNSDPWRPAYFAGVTWSGMPKTFSSGRTSWTQDYQYPTMSWKYCRRPTEEELSKRCVIED